MAGIKLEKIFRTIVSIFTVVITFALIFLIGYALFIENSLEKPNLLNIVCLLGILISIPGTYSTLKDIYFSNKNKKTFEGKCPNCRTSIEISLEEKSH